MSDSPSFCDFQTAGLLNAEGFLQLRVLRAWVLQREFPTGRTMLQTVVHNFPENVTWPGVFAGAVLVKEEAIARTPTSASERNV